MAAIVASPCGVLLRSCKTNKFVSYDGREVHALGERACAATTWRFSVADFDNDCPAGRDLNSDLAQLSQPCIRMEITFPSDYPTRPFFLRCVSPRFCWYTGHVTAGGAICIEALTTSGSPGSWNPSLNVEAILHTVFANFLDTTSQLIRTATGPGGRSGRCAWTSSAATAATRSRSILCTRRGRRSTACCGTTRRTGGDLSPVPLSPLS